MKSEVKLAARLVQGILLGFSLACSGVGGARVESPLKAAGRPSNVALYLEVHDGSESVENLTAANFRLTENGEPLDTATSRLTLLAPDTAAAVETLVLVDLGKDVARSARKDLARAVQAFLARLTRLTPVAVYGHAGKKELVFLGSYPRMEQGNVPDVTRLERFTSLGGSGDLARAALSTLGELDRRLARAARPLIYGTLVVIASGSDLTPRAPGDDIENAFGETPHRVFAVALGASGAESVLSDIGRSGFFQTDDPGSASEVLERVATEIAAKLGGAYVVSYCSPGRSGEREVTVEVEWTRKDGSRGSGSVTHAFQAKGFRAGCDPKRPPRFALRAPSVRRGGAKKPRVTTPREEHIVPPPDQPGYSQ